MKGDHMLFFRIVALESFPFLPAITRLSSLIKDHLSKPSKSSQPPSHPPTQPPSQPRAAFQHTQNHASASAYIEASEASDQPSQASRPGPYHFTRYARVIRRTSAANADKPGGEVQRPGGQGTEAGLSSGSPIAQRMLVGWQLFTVVIGAMQLLWAPIGNGSVEMTQDPVSEALQKYRFPPMFLHQAYMACLCSLVAFVTCGAVLSFVPTKTLLRVFGSTLCVYGRALWYFTMIALSVPIISTLLSIFLCEESSQSSQSSAVHQIDPDIKCWSPSHIALIVAALLSLALFYYAFVAKRMEVYSKLERAKASSVGFFFERNPVHFFALLVTKTVFCLVTTFLAPVDDHASVALYLSALVICTLLVNYRISFANVRAHGLQSGLLVAAGVSQVLALGHIRTSPLGLVVASFFVFLFAYVASVARACWPKYYLLFTRTSSRSIVLHKKSKNNMAISSPSTLTRSLYQDLLAQKDGIIKNSDHKPEKPESVHVDGGLPPNAASPWVGHHHLRHHHNRGKEFSQEEEEKGATQEPKTQKHEPDSGHHSVDRLDLTSLVGGAKYLFQTAWCPVFKDPGNVGSPTSWVSGIRALVLRSNELDCHDIHTLCNALREHRLPLESIDLSRNLIDAVAANHVGDLLNSPSSRLRFLNMNENPLLGTAGFQRIVDKVLETPQSPLRKMWFDFCNLDPNAAFALSRVLTFASANPHSCALSEISVRGNSLKTQGANILAPCLRIISPCNLRIHMEWNHFRREGVSILLHAMAQNQHTQVSHSTTWNVARLGFQMNGLTRAEMAQVMDEVRVCLYQVQSTWDELSNHSSSIHSSIQDDDKRMEMEAQASLPEPYPGTVVEAIGGEEVLVKVVDDFYYRLVTDPQLRVFFRDISMNRMRHLQYAFLYSGMGGQKPMNNTSLRRAHRHLGLTDDHFDATIGHLVAAIYQQNPEFPTEALLNLHTYTESLRPDIAQAGDSTGARFMNRDAKSFLEMYTPKSNRLDITGNLANSHAPLSDSIRFKTHTFSPFSVSSGSVLNISALARSTPNLHEPDSQMHTPPPAPSPATLDIATAADLNEPGRNEATHGDASSISDQGDDIVKPFSVAD